MWAVTPNNGLETATKYPVTPQNNTAHPDVMDQEWDHLTTKYPARWLYPEKTLPIHEIALLVLSIAVGVKSSGYPQA